MNDLAILYINKFQMYSFIKLVIQAASMCRVLTKIKLL